MPFKVGFVLSYSTKDILHKIQFKFGSTFRKVVLNLDAVCTVLLDIAVIIELSNVFVHCAHIN